MYNYKITANALAYWRCRTCIFNDCTILHQPFSSVLLEELYFSIDNIATSLIFGLLSTCTPQLILPYRPTIHILNRLSKIFVVLLHIDHK